MSVSFRPSRTTRSACRILAASLVAALLLGMLLGYLLLGRVVEQVSGEPYDQYVRGHILEPASITRMRIGGTRITELAPGEVRYYDYAGSEKVKSLYPGEGPVDWPYGGFCLHSLDSAAGWIASTEDLLRFVAALDGCEPGRRLLSEVSKAAMLARPPAPLWSDSEQYYGLGWRCKPRGDGVLAWHNGTMPGTTALLARSPDGYAWAVLMNSRPQDWDTFDKELNRTFEQLALMGALKQAVRRE